MRKQIQAICESVDVKLGDKYRVTRGWSIYTTGDIYTVIRIAKDPKARNYDDPVEGDKSSDYKYMHCLEKLKPDGSHYGSGTKDRLMAFAPDTFERIIQDGNLKLVTSDEDLTAGNIDIEDVKDVLKNLDVPKLTGLPMNKVVKVSGEFYWINLGENPTIKQQLAPLIVNALIKRDIRVGVKTTDPDYYRKGIAPNILIKKVQL